MNQQDQPEADIQSTQTESLDDLGVTGEQAEVTKGGNGGTARFPAIFNSKGTTNVL